MSVPLRIALAAICTSLMAVAFALLVRTRREHPLHARLIIALYVIGYTAILISAAGAVFHLASSDTLRFYHGMLAGVGVGSLLALIVVYLADRWERRHSGTGTDRV